MPSIIIELKIVYRNNEQEEAMYHNDEQKLMNYNPKNLFYMFEDDFTDIFQSYEISWITPLKLILSYTLKCEDNNDLIRDEVIDMIMEHSYADTVYEGFDNGWVWINDNFGEYALTEVKRCE